MDKIATCVVTVDTLVMASRDFPPAESYGIYLKERIQFRIMEIDALLRTRTRVKQKLRG